MSDIYLSLTETPSVVTLSQPVVSGVLSSTVTVANTVTVALDANSLSALENVTVTVGSSVALAAGSAQIGSVTVANFPSTQIIAGTVTANVPLVDATLASGVTLGVPVYLAGGRDGVVIDEINYINNIPAISGTVTANVNLITDQAGGNSPVVFGVPGADVNTIRTVIYSSSNSSFGNDQGAPVDSENPLPISGTVTANVGIASEADVTQFGEWIANGFNAAQPTISVIGNSGGQPFPVSGTVTANVDSTSLFDALSNYSINWNDAFPVAIKDVPNGVALPVEGVSGGVPIPVSGTVTVGAVSTSVTVSQIQGTSVTTSNFTSTAANTTVVSANSARRGLTVFNEGAGNLHICAGATATTVAYQVRLSAGDYWECPAIQTSLTHSAQFASAGTARIVEIL